MKFTLKRIIPIAILTAAMALQLRAADPLFVKTGELDIVALLPPPPAAGSDEAKIEIETVLKLQASRTPAEVDRAKAEAKLTPAAFAPVLGESFTAANLPAVFALLTDAAADSKLLSDAAKVHFARKRPQFVDDRVTPAITGEIDASYPSGHATRGMLWAGILSEIAPDKTDLLVQRGEEIGWDRVIAGVHAPTDIYAGRVVGQALFQNMKSNPDFAARLAKAKAEYEAFKLKQPAAAAMPK